MEKVIIVTGGTSGIGLNTARILAEKGCRVYEFSRRDTGVYPKVTHVQADVTDEAQVNAAVGTVLEREGHIDVVINNAGFGISGAIEFTETAEAQKQFDVNFFGMVRVNHAVLPVMRKQGYGRIINMSSVAAPIAIPFQAYYSASKAAVRTYTMALQSEVKPYGIEVCAIMPGDVATGFTAARRKTPAGDDEYGGRISRSVAVMEHDEQTGITAESAGAFVAEKALQKKVPVLCHPGRKVQVLRLSDPRAAEQGTGGSCRPDLRKIIENCREAAKNETVGNQQSAEGTGGHVREVLLLPAALLPLYPRAMADHRTRI